MNCTICNAANQTVGTSCTNCHNTVITVQQQIVIPGPPQLRYQLATQNCNSPAQSQVVVAQSSTPWWAWLILAFTVVGVIVGAGLWIHWGVQGSTTDEVIVAATVINGHTTAAIAAAETNVTGAVVASETAVKATVLTDGSTTRGAVAAAETNVKGAITASETAVKAAVSADGNATRTELADARKAMRRAIYGRASKADVQAAEAAMKSAVANQKITVKVR